MNNSTKLFDGDYAATRQAVAAHILAHMDETSPQGLYAVSTECSAMIKLFSRHTTLGRALRELVTPEEVAEFDAALQTILTFADSKARAIPLRLLGKIEEARQLENQADAAYETLPTEWRW